MAAVPADSLVNQADGLEYWSAVPATEDGMLGGIAQLAPHLSRADLQGSRAFLARLGLVDERVGGDGGHAEGRK